MTSNFNFLNYHKNKTMQQVIRYRTKTDLIPDRTIGPNYLVLATAAHLYDRFLFAAESGKIITYDYIWNSQSLYAKRT